MTTEELFQLQSNDVVLKSDLNYLIENSKSQNLSCWDGEENVINNTWQQGINWIGDFKNRSYAGIRAVIVKDYQNSDHPNQWIEPNKKFKYFFKKTNGKVSYEDIANRCLTSQRKYDILLFREDVATKSFIFKGIFKVEEINKETAHPYVVLALKK